MSHTLAIAAPKPDRAPLTAALVCYVFWGLLPILFNWAGHAGAGAFEIVAWRTIWSLPCAFGLVMLAGQGPHLMALRRRDLAALALSAGLIAINWTTYVWAVNSGRTLSASLGYYLNPLLNMAAGAVLFREKIDRAGMIAIALAGLGVVLQGAALGAFPWVSLVVALSFGGYGVVRKKIAVEAQTGLLIECMILFIPAVAYALFLAHSGQGVFGIKPTASMLLIACGPATVVPLALFAFAARRMSMTLAGFLQFITPTLQFMVGVEAGETLTPLRILSFVFIWGGVAVFAAGMWRNRQRQA
jgi:chloramphenicol-sensitive protein RarD